MFLVVDIVKIPTTVSLVVVATIITASIWLSLRATRGQGRQAPPVAAGPFRVCDEHGNPLDADGHPVEAESPEPSGGPEDDPRPARSESSRT
jgi:tellurite resistance protein TerC